MNELIVNNLVHAKYNDRSLKISEVNKRRFIRLEEINEKTTLTKGDILDAVDSGQLTFSSLVEAKNLGALIKHEESWKVAAVFDYYGMVKLIGKVSKRFALKLQPNPTERFIIVQPENTHNWRSVSNAFGNVEESDFEYLNEVPNQPEKVFAAYSGLEVVPTMNSKVGNLTDSLVGFVSKIAPEADLQEIKSKYPKTNEMRLQTKSIMVESERLRLDLHDIADVFGSDSVKGFGCQPEKSVELTVKQTVQDSVTVNGLTKPDLVNQMVLTHPIKQIIANVLMEYSQSNSRQIWNIVKKDVEDEKKQFDRDTLIFEITSDELSYFGLGDTTKTLSYRRFQNLLSEVRKNLHG